MHVLSELAVRGAMPVVLIAQLPVKKGKEADFEAIFSDLTAKVRANEPNTLLYQLCKDQKDGTYTVVEFYTDMAAVKVHGKTEHFKVLGKKMGNCLAGKPKVQLLNTLGDVSSKL